MQNRKIWILYGLPENAVESFTSFKVAEEFIRSKFGIDNKIEVKTNIWKFGRDKKILFLKQQDLIGSNDLGK